ncbi:MAG: DUF6514 family protein [Defluviitaleaceae bacterium]|nr:DUF6514 family protein [Defluviitaleaceae bacterium]
MRELLFTANFQVNLRYFRTQSQLAEGDGACCYGIHVEKYVGDEITEERDVGFISQDKEYVANLLSNLAGGLVMPFALDEVLDDNMLIFN